MNITAGIFKGRKLFSPDEHISRPTLSKIRMGVFNTLYSILGDFKDKSFLDLFGGSGIMGLEALSRGFGKVKVCELNKKSADIIKKNYSQLGLKADLFNGDSVKYLEKFNEYFDVIFIDPPYKSNLYQQVLSHIDCKLAVVESSEMIDVAAFSTIKQKKYGNTIITYITSL